MSIAHRTARSTAYNATASLIQTAIGFARAILLTRILDVECFGVYAFAGSYVIITRAIGDFGMQSALVHRVRESEGEIALRVHFTMSLVFSAVWAIGLALAGFVVIPQRMPPETILVLWALIATEFIDQLTTTARAVLVRRVIFRRIAVINIVNTLIGAVVAVVLALKGFGVWSLVATDAVSAIVLVVGFYGFRPVWRPRFGWSKDIARYLLNFGQRTFASAMLLQALDRVDDLWTGLFLGEKAVGFYSRAYRFAVYPRAILAAPVSAVAMGTYAELKDQRRRLSQAFFRVNALLVRSGFLFGGLLVLIAPEFVRIVLGEQWLPMVTAFRLMLVFTLLDPIKTTIANLFVAVGQPEKTVRARLIQLVVMVAGLFVLGPMWGIEGVALAVDIMLVIGIALLLWEARRFVDFSLSRLFGVPSIALVAGMIVGHISATVPLFAGSDWTTAPAKILGFTAVYGVILVAMERRQIPILLDMISRLRPETEHTENNLN